MAVNERCILTWDRSNERMNKKPFTEKVQSWLNTSKLLWGLKNFFVCYADLVCQKTKFNIRPYMGKMFLKTCPKPLSEPISILWSCSKGIYFVSIVFFYVVIIATYEVNHRHAASVTDELYHIMLNWLWAGFKLTTLVVIGTDCTW